MSLSMMPACMVALSGRWCFLARFTPATMTLPRSGMARMTSPSLPLTLPVHTRTVWPMRIFMPAMSGHLRSQRDDAHELGVAQPAAHRAENAGAARLALVVDEDGGVLVEADVAAVGTAPFLLR